MKKSLVILFFSFVQFASAQKQNWEEALIGSWEFEKRDIDRDIEYSSLNHFHADGKFESLLMLVNHNGEQKTIPHRESGGLKWNLSFTNMKTERYILNLMKSSMKM